MDKILIILKSDVITVYDINGTDAAVHKINGEQETYIEDYTDVPDALKMMYNDDALADLSVDVVYTNGDTEILRDFSEELLPCGEFQAFSFEKILPELLLKSQKLQPGKCVSAEFDGKAYKVSMSKCGEIEINTAEKGDAVDDTDIAAIYRTSFSVFTDNEKIAQLEDKCEKVQKECEKRISQKEKECTEILAEKENEFKQQLEKAETEWREKYNELKIQCNEYKKNSDKWDYAVQKKEDEIKRNRRVVYTGNSFLEHGSINRKKADGTIVKQGDIIAAVGIMVPNNDIEAPIGGKLIYLISEDYFVKCKIPVAIIVHPEDSKEEVNRWIKELKEEIKQRESGTFYESKSPVDAGNPIDMSNLLAWAKNIKGE